VEFALRVRDPIQKAELRIGEKKKKYRVLSPTEVVKVTLDPSEIAAYRKKGRIEISCHERKSK